MNKTYVIIKQALFLALFFVFSNLITGINILQIPFTFQTLIIFLLPFFFTLKECIVWFLGLLILCLIGVPMMANFNSGLMVLIGPSSGFIYGWLIEIVVISLAYRYIKSKPLKYIVITLGIATSLSLGGLVLSFYNELGIISNIVTCLITFLPVDLIKMMVARTIVQKIPNVYLNKEIIYGL